MPSLYEGFGLPLIEAMKYGTPCLTSNISSMPEVIDTAGLLVDPYSVDSIANGMIQLILDSNLRSDLSVAALNRSKIFRWNNTANQTLELFTRVLRDPVSKKLFNI
jgi:glycosyltransferase involved in cell wall biosynthesis